MQTLSIQHSLTIPFGVDVDQNLSDIIDQCGSSCRFHRSQITWTTRGINLLYGSE
jgi:Leu/Phe-tRNA-protein transferase